jgi:hypothetical protein
MGIDLTPETEMPCPACATTCQVGVRTGGTLVINCPEHGVVVVSQEPHPELTTVGNMDPEERLWVLETSVRFFLVSPADEDFVVVQSMTLPCNYVQLRYNEKTLWAEVSSRQWDCPYCGNRPLSEESEIHLSDLGFVGGGPLRNFESRTLPRRPHEVAALLERLLITAFNEPADFAIAVYPKRRETLRFMLTAFAMTSIRPDPSRSEFDRPDPNT